MGKGPGWISQPFTISTRLEKINQYPANKDNRIKRLTMGEYESEDNKDYAEKPIIGFFDFEPHKVQGVQKKESIQLDPSRAHYRDVPKKAAPEPKPLETVPQKRARRVWSWKHKKLKEDMETKKMDEVREFIETKCQTRPGDWAPLAELFESYRDYLLRTGRNPKTKRRFSMLLTDLGYEKIKGRRGTFQGVYYVGIDLFRM